MKDNPFLTILRRGRTGSIDEGGGKDEGGTRGEEEREQVVRHGQLAARTAIDTINKLLTGRHDGGKGDEGERASRAFKMMNTSEWISLSRSAGRSISSQRALSVYNLTERHVMDATRRCLSNNLYNREEGIKNKISKLTNLEIENLFVALSWGLLHLLLSSFLGSLLLNQVERTSFPDPFNLVGG